MQAQIGNLTHKFGKCQEPAGNEQLTHRRSGWSVGCKGYHFGNGGAHSCRERSKICLSGRLLLICCARFKAGTCRKIEEMKIEALHGLFAARECWQGHKFGEMGQLQVGYYTVGQATQV